MRKYIEFIPFCFLFCSFADAVMMERATWGRSASSVNMSKEAPCMVLLAGHCVILNYSESTELYCHSKTVYPWYDSDNCGRCDNRCSDGSYCYEGTCISRPYNVQTICDGAVVNIYNNNYHCGGCHHVCGSYQSCVQGRCVYD